MCRGKFCKVMQIFVDKGSDTGVHVSGKRFAEFGFRDDTDNTKEMLRGRAYGAQHDSWSFGCMIYELCTQK